MVLGPMPGSFTRPSPSALASGFVFFLDLVAGLFLFLGFASVSAPDDSAFSWAFLACHSRKLQCGQPRSQGRFPLLMMRMWLMPCFSQLLSVTTTVPKRGRGRVNLHSG